MLYEFLQTFSPFLMLWYGNGTALPACSQLLIVHFLMAPALFSLTLLLQKVLHTFMPYETTFLIAILVSLMKKIILKPIS